MFFNVILIRNDKSVMQLFHVSIVYCECKKDTIFWCCLFAFLQLLTCDESLPADTVTYSNSDKTFLASFLGITYVVKFASVIPAPGAESRDLLFSSDSCAGFFLCKNNF